MPIDIESGLGTGVLFQADSSAIYNERTAIILGLVTLFFALLAFASCRTCLAWLGHLGLKNLMNNRPYQQFYRFHAYYWWILGVALVTHMFMAVFHTGLPQPGDPDAYIHWRILGFGLGGAVAMSSVFSSCRLCVKIFSHSIEDATPVSRGYSLFNRYHTYYWLLFGLIVSLHFYFAFNHAGVWPGG